MSDPNVRSKALPLRISIFLDWGCSLAILVFAIGLVRGYHHFPRRQCREKKMTESR